MKNSMAFPFTRYLDDLTGQYIDMALPYDILNASGESSPTAAGTFTLASFVVEPGQECIIGQASLGAAAAALAEITVPYTSYGQSITLTRYIYLSAAGYVDTDTNFFHNPLMAFLNPVADDTPATVSMQIISAAASTQYVGNMAYIVRSNE